MLRLFVKKIGQTFDVGEFAKLPEASQQYLVQYGVDQSGTDCHASVTRKDWKGTDAEFKAEVTKHVMAWITKIQTGAVRARIAEDPQVVARNLLLSKGYTEAMVEQMLAGPKPAPKKVA